MVDVNKNPTQGLKVVCLSRVIPSFETLKCLCKIIVSSCISSLTHVAERTAVAMLSGQYMLMIVLVLYHRSGNFCCTYSLAC